MRQGLERPNRRGWVHADRFGSGLERMSDLYPIPSESQRVRGPVLGFAVFAILFWAGFAGLNVVVDPRGEFGTGLFQPLVADSDDVLQMKLHLLRETSSTRVVIFGSSTTMNVQPEFLEFFFNVSQAFNLAFGNAKVADYLEILPVVLEDATSLESIIVFVDLHQLTEVGDGVESRPNRERPNSSLDMLTNRQYAVDTLSSLWYSFVGFPPTRWSFNSDGGAERELVLGIGNLSEVGEQAFFGSLRGILAEGHINQVTVQQMASFVDAADAAGLPVTFVLQPWHPSAISDPKIQRGEASRTMREFHEVMSHFCSGPTSVLATQWGISSHPISDFTDSVHYGEQGAKAVLSIATQPNATICPLSEIKSN